MVVLRLSLIGSIDAFRTLHHLFTVQKPDTTAAKAAMPSVDFPSLLQGRNGNLVTIGNEPRRSIVQSLHSRLISRSERFDQVGTSPKRVPNDSHMI